MKFIDGSIRTSIKMGISVFKNIMYYHTSLFLVVGVI